MAARVGNKSCLEHLFNKESAEEILSKKNKDGQTLLHLSILSGRVECVKYLIKKSPIGIFPEQNTQKKFLFLAVLSSNKECLEFVAKELVDKKVAASIKVLCDENNNTLLHMAALADGVVCSQYIIESVSKSTIRKLFNTNNHKLTPLHLAAMTLNAEVIEYFITDNYHYTEKMLNVVSKSDRTPLHYLVMHDNDFERILDEDFKQGQFLKKLVLEKRKQNEHLREKAIKALLYLTTINRGQIINKKINFDIKDNKGKTFLKYALEYKNISILKLFLDPFYEIRENLKREYDKLELQYQEKSRKILEFITMVMLASNFISYFCIPNNQQSESAIKKTFDYIVMFYSILSLTFMLSNLMIGNKKEPIKRKIESYTEKINSIEEVTGKLAKTIVEVHNSEGYNAILEQLAKNSEDILQVKSMLDKLMHAVSLESRDKLNISSQKMNRRGSTVLAERRSSSFLGNLGEKLDQYVRRTSRVQDTMDKLDNESCFITINEHSESNPKAPKSKLKNVAIKLKIGNIFSKKKEDLIASSSLSEGANQKKINEESCRLIKQLGDINKNLIFPTFFNSRCSTLREECGNNHRAAHHVSYSSVNNLPSVSKEGVNKFPSVILSSPEVGISVKETDFLGLECRPRVYSSPPCMSKR